jgi:hypothetical protein
VAKLTLENSINSEIYTTLSGKNWETIQPIDVSDIPENLLFDGSKASKKERIENTVKQLKTSLALREKFIRLEEKYKYSTADEKSFVYQDWADYARYFINYACDYSSLVQCINELDNTTYKVQLKDPGTYSIKKREAKEKLSKIKDNQWKMEEIEKRFQQRLMQA